MQTWQFSLRALFIAITALALLIVLAANAPGVATTFAVLSFPFFIGGMLTHIAATRQFARVLMTLGAVILFIASVFLFLLAEQHDGMSMDRFLALSALWGYGLMCGFVAWIIPNSCDK